MTYHYTESGLSNVYLHGGVARQETPYGAGVSIQDMDGLHELIGRNLVSMSEPWEASQVRFLRGELDLSQAALAHLMGVDVRQVKRWEKEGLSNKNTPAQRLLGAIYLDSIEGSAPVREYLRKVSQTDARDAQRRIDLERQGDKWELAA